MHNRLDMVPLRQQRHRPLHLVEHGHHRIPDGADAAVDFSLGCGQVNVPGDDEGVAGHADHEVAVGLALRGEHAVDEAVEVEVDEFADLGFRGGTVVGAEPGGGRVVVVGVVGAVEVHVGFDGSGWVEEREMY